MACYQLKRGNVLFSNRCHDFFHEIFPFILNMTKRNSHPCGKTLFNRKSIQACGCHTVEWRPSVDMRGFKLVAFIHNVNLKLLQVAAGKQGTTCEDRKSLFHTWLLAFPMPSQKGGHPVSNLTFQLDIHISSHHSPSIILLGCLLWIPYLSKGFICMESVVSPGSSWRWPVLGAPCPMP